VGVLYFLVFSLGVAVGGLLFGADSRDRRLPQEKVGSIAPLTA
jgi:hypothetical protein